MHYINYKNSQIRGTIVFIHGNSSSSEVFHSVLQSELMPYSKVAIDLPGHGASNNGYEIEDYSIENYKKYCIPFINELQDDILLVGNSYGGHLAIEIANSINRLKGLVVFGTPPVKKPLNLEDVYLPCQEFQVFFTEKPNDMEIDAAAHVSVHDKKCKDLVVSYYKKTDPKVRKAVANDVSEGQFANQHDIFINLDLPKLIINGKQDPIVNLEYLKQIQAQCQNKCELIEFDQCGHYPSIEKPKEFCIAINAIATRVFNKRDVIK